VTARPEVVLLNFGAALGLEALHIIDDDRFFVDPMVAGVVDAVVPFERASDAYYGIIQQRQGGGKMLVSMIAAN
jgi:hypothetical protein